MATEPIWTLKDLANHHNMPTHAIVGWSSEHPLPEQFKPPARNYTMQFGQKPDRMKFKRSALLRWFRETQAAIAANQKDRS